MVFAEISAGTSSMATQTGVGLGSILAVTFPWARNRSILYAILAGVLSWIYVIYFALTRQPEEQRRE